jgi:hypothetical protein
VSVSRRDLGMRAPSQGQLCAFQDAGLPAIMEVITKW